MATNLAKAYVQIVPSAEGMKGMIEQVMGKDLEEAGEKAGNSIASKIKNIIVAAGIGKVVSQAFTEGGALEQSLGGIETLYKENADKMKAYAKEAYKTSGVSENIRCQCKCLYGKCYFIFSVFDFKFKRRYK